MYNKVIAIILIVVGAVLMWWGYDVYASASSTISRAVSGDTLIAAWLGMAGGGIGLLEGGLSYLSNHF